MSNKMIWLKDEKDNKIAPKTLTKAVQDENGQTLDTLLNNVTNEVSTLNTNLENNYTKCLIKKARIPYNGTINSNHVIDISSQLPDNATYIPMQWGYEKADETSQLLGNCFVNGYLCDCSVWRSSNAITLIPRDSGRIENFPYLFVYYWIILP